MAYAHHHGSDSERALAVALMRRVREVAGLRWGIHHATLQVL